MSSSQSRDAAPVLRVRLSCSDCTGVDPMGCFGGGSELLHEKRAPYAVRTFSSVDEAKDAGYDECDPSPWWFEVIDEDDEVLYAGS